MIFRRRRFGDVIARQLDLFLEENEELIADCEAALERYNSAERDEAEELYGDYVDLVESGTEILAAMRDRYALTLAEDDAATYEAEFDRTVVKRLPRFGLEIENR